MERKTLMEMIKCVAILVAISLLAGILLAVVSHFTTVRYTVDIDYSAFDALYPAGAGNWVEVKTEDEFTAEQNAAKSQSYGQALMYAKNADGTVIVYASGTGGWGGKGANAYVCVGLDGNIISVKGENGAESYWDSHYVPGRAAFEGQFVGLNIMGFSRIGASGKDAPSGGGVLLISPVAGASQAANAVCNAVSAGARFIEAAGLLGELADPNQEVADSINAVKDLGVTATEVLNGDFSFSTEDGEFVKLIQKTGFDVYLAEITADQFIIIVLDTATNHIDSIGTHGYTGTISADDITEYKDIEMSVAAAELPLDKLGDAGSRTGLDLDAYKAVKILAFMNSDPDIANKPNRDALKNYSVGELEFVTIDISGIAVPTLNDAELIYAAEAADGTIGVIVDFAHGQTASAAGTGADISATDPFAMIVYIKDGKIIGMTAVKRDLSATTGIYGGDSGYAPNANAWKSSFENYDLTGASYSGPASGSAIVSGSTVSAHAFIDVVKLLQTLYADITA